MEECVGFCIIIVALVFPIFIKQSYLKFKVSFPKSGIWLYLIGSHLL